MANWKETSATAWAGLDLKIGTPGSNNAMATSLATIGNIEDMSSETEEGEKKEWKDINGKIVDSYQQENTLKWTVKVKNLNKSTLEKFWDVEEDTSNGSLKVKGTSTSKKFSIQIVNSVQNAEVFSAPYCSVSSKLTFEKDKGYGMELTFTILDPGNGKELFVIGQTA